MWPSVVFPAGEPPASAQVTTFFANGPDLVAHALSAIDRFFTDGPRPGGATGTDRHLPAQPGNSISLISAATGCQTEPERLSTDPSEVWT